MVLSTGAENRESFPAELHLWPIKFLCGGGRVAKGAAAGGKYRSWKQREGSEENSDRGSRYFILEQNMEDKNLTTEGE